MTEGIARVLYTSDGEPVTVYEHRGNDLMGVFNMEMLSLLKDIKNELKVLNFHMTMLDEMNVNIKDVEGS